MYSYSFLNPNIDVVFAKQPSAKASLRRDRFRLPKLNVRVLGGPPTLGLRILVFSDMPIEVNRHSRSPL